MFPLRWGHDGGKLFKSKKEEKTNNQKLHLTGGDFKSSLRLAARGVQKGDALIVYNARFVSLSFCISLHPVYINKCPFPCITLHIFVFFFLRLLNCFLLPFILHADSGSGDCFEISYPSIFLARSLCLCLFRFSSTLYVAGHIYP